VRLQGYDSLVTFKIHNAAPYISPINVAHSVTFEAGAKIKIEPAANWTPDNYQIFTLMKAASVIGQSNVTIESPSGWLVYWTQTNPKELQAEYMSACGLLGIEPVFVLALLHAQRRWRRARSHG